MFQTTQIFWCLDEPTVYGTVIPLQRSDDWAVESTSCRALTSGCCINKRWSERCIGIARPQVRFLLDGLESHFSQLLSVRSKMYINIYSFENSVYKNLIYLSLYRTGCPKIFESLKIIIWYMVLLHYKLYLDYITTSSKLVASVWSACHTPRYLWKRLLQSCSWIAPMTLSSS